MLGRRRGRVRSGVGEMGMQGRLGGEEIWGSKSAFGRHGDCSAKDISTDSGNVT